MWGVWGKTISSCNGEEKMKINIRRWLRLLLSLSLIGGLFVAGCSNLEANSLDSSSDNASIKEKQSIAIDTGKSTMSNDLPKLEGNAKVELKVNGSTVIIEVNGNDAPMTAGNFVDLVQRGVYDGLAFHRVVKDPQPFVVQGGDPQGKDQNFPVSRMGTGSFVDPETGRPRYIPLEIKLEGQKEPTYSKALGRQAGLSAPRVVLNHDRGAVAMARSQAPDSASSQFYIALGDLQFLDGDYAVFGKVTEGMDAVDQIKQGDRIESAKVIEGAENLKK